MKPKILLVDLETSPIKGYFWRIWDENIGLNQILEDTTILSYAAKWLDEKKIFYEDVSNQKNLRDDSKILKSLWKLLDEAEIVCAQNGQAFDLPLIRARMLFHGIPPPSPFRTIDTLLQARKHFRFTSNKLEHLSEILGCKVRKDKHPEFQGFELWREYLNRNPKAFKTMKRYNVNDVLALEDVYLKMRPWMVQHPNLGVYMDVDRPSCPKCGSRVERRGIRYTNSGEYPQFHCLNAKCGGYSRGKNLISAKKQNKNQLSN